MPGFKSFVSISSTAVTEYHRLQILNNRFIFSQFWRLEVQGQDAVRVSFWRGRSSWLVGGFVLLPGSSQAFPLCMWREGCLVSLPLFIKKPVLSGQSPALTMLFNLNYLL